MLYGYTSSPLGRLLLCGDERRLTAVYTAPDLRPAPPATWRRADAPFHRVREQLEQYFAGERREFALELDLGAAAPGRFHRRVWAELLTIGFGATVTYAQLAARLGNPAAARAVGAANARNPVSIIVPCHRVLGADGGLTGYAGGLAHKAFLLGHEAAVLRDGRTMVAKANQGFAQMPRSAGSPVASRMR